MKKKFDSEYIKNISKELSESSLISYNDLPKYDLFLSQVIDYLNDKFPNEKFTKNIVQNYTKSEVITKPEYGKKRGYTKMHLIQLVLLSYMRPILTTEEIKKVFRLAFNDINNRNDDILSWEEAYKVFVSIQQSSLGECEYVLSSISSEEKMDHIIKQFNLESKDEERIQTFIVVLSLIAQASIIKKMVQKIVSEYDNE